ncbi:hypothetical protein [Amycolatopsis sp. NPDC051716]|uniref:hypothetical protein n=1 Tax=Amycolatopsis sp. NPDC051716 TaxID=3155804 RepID=UPI003442BA38
MNYQEIDRGPLWTGRLYLPRAHDPADVQAIVNDLVAQTLTTVAGYYASNPPSFTLLRWPEKRPGYLPAPSDGACVLMLGKLGERLDAVKVEYDIVPPGRLHVLLGRKMNGYGDGELAPLDAYRADTADYVTFEAHMITARVSMRRGLMSYDEPAVINEANIEDEPLIHAAADRTQQHHYAIEFGATSSRPSEVVLYETEWARRAN